MKNRLLLGAMLVGVAGLFTACSDDNDSNPTLIQPTEFTLNTPAYANETVRLENTSEFTLTWSQPQYTAENAPINVTYEIQMSPTNSFTVSTSEASDDETGATVADYTVLNRTTQLCNIDMTGYEVDRQLVKMLGWEENTVPADMDLYVRVQAYVLEGTKKVNPIASNSVLLKVAPYYMLVKAADPELWYLIGACIGDGTWGNDGEESIGVSVYPLCPSESEKYDEDTGKGVLTYTGYFVQGLGFKVIKTPGKWDNDEWGGSMDSPIFKGDNGGNGGSDIKVPVSGYYTITLDTQKNSFLMKEAKEAPAEYSQMLISGDFNGWAVNEPMNAVDKVEGAKNHVWQYTLKTATATKLKFVADTAWKVNWGATGFPYGWGYQNGADIPVEAGTWNIIFNDVTGYYHFYEVK